LPPTETELADYLADTSTNAFAAIVDRLLASPRYGERWGRYWLDLAKYADTRGQQDQGRDNRYLWSWTYRDWVIRSFNEDLPYDQFLLRQLAADKLDLSDKRELAAMGYLTLGNRFGNNPNDIIDDRIDLIGKSTMGLTLACARCHDHKFDPIPSRDYYSLHGVFNSVPSHARVRFWKSRKTPRFTGIINGNWHPGKPRSRHFGIGSNASWARSGAARSRNT
jgi:hypothetical protein